MGGAAFRLPALALLAILVIAAALRLAGLRWGLPNQAHCFSYHPDEIFLLLPSLGFARGDWNPHFFNYGTLYIYLVGVPATLSGLAAVPFPQGLAPLYLLGRIITALLGIGSVALLYVAVRKESRALALISATLLAVLPLHVIDSHYATVDVPATFFLVLAFFFTLRGVGAQHAVPPTDPGGTLVRAQHAVPLHAIAAGLAVGLAAATKYNAGLFLLPVLAAPLLPPRQKQPRLWFAGVVLGSLIGFLIGCPFVSDPKFARDFLFELNHARTGGTYAFADTGSGWGYHLLHGLPIALGFPLLFALGPGIIAAIRVPSRAARLSLLWCLLYFAVIGFSKERFIRYLVPMTPFLAVVAAAGLLWLWRVPRTHLMRAGAAAVGLAVVLLTGLYAMGQVSPFVTEDVRDRAMSRLGVGRVGVTQPPWYFTPPISPYNGGPFPSGAFEELNERQGSRIVVTGWEAAKLRAEHPRAFVLSDLESVDLLRLKDKDATAFVAALGSMYRNRFRIGPAHEPFSWLAPGRAWAPPDWLYPSPEISVYRNTYDGA